ncbi:hypothetical protein [Streptomyces sp. NBC_01198]|uniref:hypothetical protein n=1 Tax=Streptomyces sp. NBC_01198 TaxID=2903769 RepID=UPI002E16527F|nr:hypothetical protein OG702_30485 [Streptomyces sp. NBC_01198]
MRNHVRHSRSERIRPAFEEGHERDAFTFSAAEPADSDADAPDDLMDGIDADEAFEEDFGDVVRLSCPDCGRPIAVFTDEEQLPQHALCPTPWNPFGLTVCGGSGRAVAEARPADGDAGAPGQQDLAALLTLPVGLDWRTQPFSHVGGPESRPIHMPEQRLAA